MACDTSITVYSLLFSNTLKKIAPTPQTRNTKRKSAFIAHHRTLIKFQKRPDCSSSFHSPSETFCKNVVVPGSSTDDDGHALTHTHTC